MVVKITISNYWVYQELQNEGRKMETKFKIKDFFKNSRIIFKS